MKDFIVLIASIILGLAIFELVAGNGDGSFKSTLKDVWSREIITRDYEAY